MFNIRTVSMYNDFNVEIQQYIMFAHVDATCGNVGVRSEGK